MSATLPEIYRSSPMRFLILEGVRGHCRGDDLRRNCSHATRRGASRPMWRSCRSYYAKLTDAASAFQCNAEVHSRMVQAAQDAVSPSQFCSTLYF